MTISIKELSKIGELLGEENERSNVCYERKSYEIVYGKGRKEFF